MLLPQRRIASGSQPDTRVADLKNPISPPYYLRAGFLWDRLLGRFSHRASLLIGIAVSLGIVVTKRRFRSRGIVCRAFDGRIQRY